MRANYPARSLGKEDIASFGGWIGLFYIFSLCKKRQRFVEMHAAYALVGPLVIARGVHRSLKRHYGKVQRRQLTSVWPRNQVLVARYDVSTVFLRRIKKMEPPCGKACTECTFGGHMSRLDGFRLLLGLI